MDTSLRYSIATEGCVSNDFFRHSLDDSPAPYLTQLPSPSLNTIELIVIHNRPCEHSSKLQLMKDYPLFSMDQSSFHFMDRQSAWINSLVFWLPVPTGSDTAALFCHFFDQGFKPPNPSNIYPGTIFCAYN